MARAPRKPRAAAGNKVDRGKIIAAYKQMLKYQFVGTGVLVAAVVAILLVSYATQWFAIPLLLLIMLAGMLGAFFSALTRLYNVDQAGVAIFTSTVKDLGGGPYLLMYSFVPPVIGAIAAVVLYLVFVAGYLHTDLFPAIGCLKGKSCVSLQDLMDNYWPKEPQDYGKALVWAFIAGFSERLVPDVLSSLASRAEGQVKKA
jgi:uncharacterized membrane protein YccC